VGLPDGSGNKAAEKWHLPFGEEQYTSGSLFTDRRFTGQRWDDALGLYDYRARYCDPALCRFTQACLQQAGGHGGAGGRHGLKPLLTRRWQIVLDQIRRPSR